jgi:hypothetical protein
MQTCYRLQTNVDIFNVSPECSKTHSEVAQKIPLDGCVVGGRREKEAHFLPKKREAAVKFNFEPFIGIVPYIQKK